MQLNNPFFDDMAKLATSAGGTLLEWRKEAERVFQETAENWLAKMNLVTREEFEVVRDMAAKAREENDALKARLDALEKKA
jgi:BMFP domain-containing protein YqiC